MKYNLDIFHRRYEGEDNKKYENFIFGEYLSQNNINYFDDNLYSYNERNLRKEYSQALVFMTDEQDSENFSISNIKSIKTSDIILLNNKNHYQEMFIKNNIQLIWDIIKEEIKKDNINEIMMNSLLKIIKKIINYLNKEDILTIFKFLWDYYNKNKLEENKWIFMSKEYIEYIFSEFYDLDILNFSKTLENNYESLSDLFLFFIKGNSLKYEVKN